MSTDDQELDNQRPEVLQLARARRLHVVSTYEEHASAAKSRPVFEQMMRDAHVGKFEVLIVWSLDRFGRSMVGNVNAVLELERRKVEVLSVREPWLDMGGPMRPLLVCIFGWVAEQERVQLVARTRAGLERARRRGIRLGRPPARIDLARAHVLRYSQGLSLRAVARELRVPLATLHRAMRDPSKRSEMGGAAKGP